MLYLTYRFFFSLFLVISIPILCLAEKKLDYSTIDHTITTTTKKLEIIVHYPEIHNTVIDQDIKRWAQQLVEKFKITNSEKEITIGPYELRADYSITKPSNKAVSIIYTITDYTGGAHGNLEISVFNYNMPTGQPLDLTDIFEDLNSALKIMAKYSYKCLSETLGDMSDEEMLRTGTAPELDNYNSIALTPKGIRIFFQPYQVAPWAAGPQQIDMTLEDLKAAKPNQKLWGSS